MKKLLALSLVAVFPLVDAADARACEGANKEAHADCDCPGKQGATVAIKELSVDDLAKMLDAKKAGKGPAVHVVDVNSTETRQKAGVIPGAILLTSSAKYDATKELPKNKAESVVFYCGSEKCSASKTAAKKAVESGYTAVSVLPAGIKGWKDKGLATELKPAS